VPPKALPAWSQRLLLKGHLARASPETLRRRLRHTAARVTRHARRTVVHYQRSWPWTPDLLAAFDRLAALPPALQCQGKSDAHPPARGYPSNRSRVVSTSPDAGSP
jgi:hypothetical protein